MHAHPRSLQIPLSAHFVVSLEIFKLYLIKFLKQIGVVNENAAGPGFEVLPESYLISWCWTYS
jgi:hypothetical protein